ncbi:hypothetical protein [Sulfuriroseicoccus oceanibius]|uniref:Uncharacterized protein n=1 Tax=Sulfuriroseicoccus oceanibius TaxID=2707525 RepID=A0A7T7JBP0_9BACT|nr:hypothetical protein [Sulfuriroseicoccus oceanibius]QQL44453.1 hypothetical protein G3M56_011235 [Sulfuriroseicoccus oceanibius]
MSPHSPKPKMSPMVFRIIMAVIVLSSIGFLMMVHQIGLPDIAGIPMIVPIAIFELGTIAIVGFVLHRSMVGGNH